MKAGKVRTIAAAGLALACLAGCLPQDERAGGEWLTVRPGIKMGDATMYRDIQFADIPVPAGYILLQQESYSFQGSLFRNGILKYHGPVDSSYALEFFRRHLPARGWTQDKIERGFDVRVLYFSKGQEKLIVILRDIQGGSRVEMQLDNIGKNDLLLKGRLSDPGYTAPPTYLQPQQTAPLSQGLSGVTPENTSGSSPMR